MRHIQDRERIWLEITTADNEEGGRRGSSSSLGTAKKEEGTGGGGDARPTPRAGGWSLDAA